MQFWTGGGSLAKARARPASLPDAYDAFVAGAARAEQLGYDAYAAPEHHFMYDGFLPHPLQALAAAAEVTSRIRLLTGAMLLPLYDPLEAAEYAATLDVLCGGRVTLGLGMGYRPLEFDGLATDKRTRGARLVEAMEVIERATSGEPFSYQGQHYRYDRVRVFPDAVQRPVEAWFCGGTSSAAALRAGRAGLRYWLANAPFDRVESMVAEYRRAGREAGWPEDRLRVAAFKDICVGETVTEAEAVRDALVSDFYEEHILGYGYLVDDGGRHLYNPPPDHPVYRRFVDSIFCGTVEMVAEELARYERLGFDAVYIASPQKGLIAEKVLPEFLRDEPVRS